MEADTVAAKLKPLLVLSLGAGVQSSTLALMAAQGEIEMPDFAIFADTQSEPPSVYQWLSWLETKLPYPVRRVSAGNLADIALQIRTSCNGVNYQKSAPPAWVTNGKGRVSILMRQCTSDFKISPIHKALRDAGGKERRVIQVLGISWDEVSRMKPSRVPWIMNSWPLIDKRMTRQQCVEWMINNGYPTPPKSSCWFCPYRSDKEWKRLRDEETEYFDKAVKWEASFQKTMHEIKGFYGTPFLHRSCVPIGKINFDDKNGESGQTDMFVNECEGLCGV